MVADFCYEVILAITEKLVKFIENNGIDVHHFDFEFNQPQRHDLEVPIRISGPFQTFNFAF